MKEQNIFAHLDYSKFHLLDSAMWLVITVAHSWQAHTIGMLAGACSSFLC